MNRPSMNLAAVYETNSEANIRRKILHEFGHAIGAVHEHQSPRANIPWNKPVVYRELGGPPNNWPKEKIDRNMFRTYPHNEVKSSNFDKHSVMIYWIPSRSTTNGMSTNYTTTLSERDQAFIKFCYPGRFLDAGQFNTMEVRLWDKPTLTNQKEECFYEKYPSPPGLVLGLNWLDIDAGHNIRIKAEALHADQEKFTASLTSWSDTVLYSAGMTWLEIAPRFQFVQFGTFDTSEIRPWNEPRLQNSKRINFSTPFKDQPPKVVCFLKSLDMDKGKNWRVKTYVSDVTTEGFTIHIDSWADSVLYSASASWLAYPADQPGVTSGRFSTADVRPWDKPQQNNSSSVTFSRPFSKVPQVLMALDELDYEHGKNLRLRLSTSMVSETGLQWHLQAWDDSVMYQSGASYFAWE